MEGSVWPAANATPGTLHYIPPDLSAFEPAKPLAPPSSANVNTLLWVGGMFDTFGSVAYPFVLARSLAPTWSLMTTALSSAGHSWGTSSIARDAADMAKIVAHVKKLRPHGKVVIMGHSTGCQDCMEYTVGKGADQRPAVDGVILQAPVSDREALEKELPEALKHEADQLALKMCRERHERDVMPIRLTEGAFGKIAITARRWVDVSSPGPNHNGADDYFSSDLSDERLSGTFGKLPSSTPLLILYSGSEENMPDSVDKEKLVQKWIGIVKAGGGTVDEDSAVVKGASHNLNGNPDEVTQDLVKRVVAFVGRINE
jgi:pimeloyl-ACP methyl ester carboxylesterase